MDLEALQSEEGIEIAPGVRVRLRSLADYQQNPENPVAHTPRNLGSVVESIHKVGAARSGLAKDGKMLAGNLTSEAMAEAGIEGVIEITTDGTKWVVVNRPDLSPEQEKQAAYGDQQGSFLAGWGLDQMLADVEAGVDLEGIFTDWELESFEFGDTDLGRDGQNVSTTWREMRDAKWGDRIHVIIGDLEIWLTIEKFEQLKLVLQTQFEKHDIPFFETFDIIITEGIKTVECGDN